MMLFLIFLFVDLSVIGIFYAVYGRKRKYSEGMLMGVHLPESAACGEEVRRMMERYHARTKKFYLWNLAAVILIGGSQCLLSCGRSGFWRCALEPLLF